MEDRTLPARAAPRAKMKDGKKDRGETPKLANRKRRELVLVLVMTAARGLVHLGKDRAGREGAGADAAGGLD